LAQGFGSSWQIGGFFEVIVTKLEIEEPICFVWENHR